MMFGNNWNSLFTIHGKITNDEVNHWVQLPDSKGNKLLSNIYKFLNSKHMEDQDWYGWSNIWKLNVAPRTKSFIQLLIQGKIKTYDYLYHLNLGPADFCVFCGLVLETTNHLFRQCSISTRIWKMVEVLVDIKII